MALPAASGVIMQVSPCQPRSSIFETPSAIPALIFSALKPGGKEGSEKSTVSGFWPTNSIRVMGFLRSSGGDGTGVEDRLPAKIVPQKFAGGVERRKGIEMAKEMDGGSGTP